jgi:hypothetical protein
MTIPLKDEMLEQVMPMDAIDMVRQSAPPALSDERDVIMPLGVDVDPQSPEMMQDIQVSEQPPYEVQQALTTLYGPDFPLLHPKDADQEAWVRWIQNTWDRLGPGIQRRLHLVQRNRLFRNGIQWISSQGFGPWREPSRPRDQVRVVENVIAPALDMRIQILTEQRPGFRVRPVTGDPDDMKRAEAKQLALEYQYDQQSLADVIREAAYWAQTDGVSFLESYWDPEAGPWHEVYPEQGAQMGAVPGGAPAGGAPMGGGGPMGPVQQGPLGDVKTRVRRIEQVRVSSNATSTQRPWFWIIRDVMTKAEALRVYGMDVATEMAGPDLSENLANSYPMWRMGYQLPNIDELKLEQEKVDRYTVYCEKSFGLPKGLTLVVVGTKVVFMGPLLIGMVPVVRWADGSTDPAFYPSAEMEKWVDNQQRINTLKSKWIENIRLNTGPKMLAKANAISPETFTAANMTIMEVKGLGGLNEIAHELKPFSVGQDVKELLAMEIKHFESLTGWNDVSRGAMTDQSGRAILAVREQLERVFSPMINAASKAMTEWGKVACAWMAWGYDYPRDIGVEGRSRPDLARALKADDFDGVVDLFIDPETLMPMPRALRLFLMKDMFQMGLMGPQEYRRRLPFAWMRSINSPDEDQEAAAKRYAEMLRQGVPAMQIMMAPEKWVWDEAIFQDVIQRELLLSPDTDPMIKMEAFQLWSDLAMQAQMKAGVVPALPQGGAGGGGGASGQGMSPQEQPFASTNPGIAAQPGATDQDNAARQFESQQKTMDQS